MSDTRTATCHTEGCANAEQPIEVVCDYPDPDNPDAPLTTVGAVQCGVCGQPITDIQPPLDQPLGDTDPEAVPQ